MISRSKYLRERYIGRRTLEKYIFEIIIRTGSWWFEKNNAMSYMECILHAFKDVHCKH